MGCPGALAERADHLAGAAAGDPALARDLAAAAARNPRSTWCITVTGPDHRPAAHGCGRPPPRRDTRGTTARAARDGPGHIPGGDHDPPGTGTLRLDIAALTGTAGPAGGAGDLVFTLENPAGPCDHEHEGKGHDPGIRLRHLTGILNACNHRDKQAPGWHLEHAGARGWFRWTTPSGRSYLSRPTQYPD